MVPYGWPRISVQSGGREELSGPIDPLRAVTPDIVKVEGCIRGLRVTVYDSPGLQDGNHKDESYLNLISEIVVSVIVQWLILTGCSRHPGMVTCHACEMQYH